MLLLNVSFASIQSTEYYQNLSKKLNKNEKLFLYINNNLLLHGKHLF